MNVGNTRTSPPSCRHTPYAASGLTTPYDPIPRNTNGAFKVTPRQPLLAEIPSISTFIVICPIPMPLPHTAMDSMSDHPSTHPPKHGPVGNSTGRRNRREGFNSEQLSIVPVPREELPDEMRSVLESLISSQRPSLTDTRSTRPDFQQTNTSIRSRSRCCSTEGNEPYDYDGRNDYRIHGPNAAWPFNSALKGKGLPSKVYHTHKVVPRSRPNAKEQLGKRKWHPSKRHGRVIQQDFDAYANHGFSQRTHFSNSESLLDLSVRSGRAVKETMEKVVGCGRLWRWPCRLKSKVGKVTTNMFRRG